MNPLIVQALVIRAFLLDSRLGRQANGKKGCSVFRLISHAKIQLHRSLILGSIMVQPVRYLSDKTDRRL